MSEKLMLAITIICMVGAIALVVATEKPDFSRDDGTKPFVCLGGRNVMFCL